MAAAGSLDDGLNSLVKCASWQGHVFCPTRGVALEGHTWFGGGWSLALWQ